MKRFLCIQLFLLFVGIGWLTYAFFNSSLLIPLDPICRFLKLPFRTSKAVLSRQRLMLYDVEGQFQEIRLGASRIDFSPLKSEKLLERWQCEIQNGTLATSFGKFDALNGLIRKNNDDYCALLSAHQEILGLLQGNFHSIRALQHYKKMLENLPSSSVGTEGFLLKNLQLHTDGSAEKLSVMFKTDAGTFGDVRATDVSGQMRFDERSASAFLLAQQIDTPKCSVRHLSANVTYAFKDRCSVEFHGDTDVFNRSLNLYGRLEDFQPDTENEVQFSVDSNGLDAKGEFLFHMLRKRWSLSKGSFIANPNFCDQIADVPQNPYRISFNAPLVAQIQGNLQQATVRLNASDFTVNDQPFKQAEAKLSKDADVFSWDATFKLTNEFVSDVEKHKADLRTYGTCDFSEQKGQVFCKGTVAPALINALEPYSPPWWDAFSNNFRFFDKNPCADVAFQWDTKQHLNRLFGYTEAQNGRYKQTDFKKLAVTFSHQPGYANIKLHQLQTPDGEGSCFIRWPYDPKDEQHEQFDFNGSGTFSVQRWETLIEDFIGISDIEHLKRLHPLIPTKASFEGCVSFPELPNDYWEVAFQSPIHKIDAMPVEDLEVIYRRDAEKIRANFHGKLFHTAPFKANLLLHKETFKLEVEGEQLPTGSLLQQPMFAKWVADIPPDNLKTYSGLLDLNIKAKGRRHPEFSVEGEGFADFKNPELSQIHLLGPLQKLLFAKIPFLPTVNFDRFTSEFSFNEREIRTQKAELSGDTAQADIEGVVDLENHWLKGDLNFSFLDHRQMGIPIVRHAFQIFTPVTRAFSASVNGSLKDPKYFITFNPIRWALPKAKRPQKKP